MFCDLIEIFLRIEFRTKGRNALRGLFFVFNAARYAVSRPHFEVLLWKQRRHRTSRLHSEGINAEVKATKSRFDERTDFSARIASLPFIRNHGFARNDTKGAVFKAFPAFLKAFLEMPKKKTVNLSLENAILCLRFGLVRFILTNHFCVGCLFFDYRDAIIERRVVQCRGWSQRPTPD